MNRNPGRPKINHPGVQARSWAVCYILLMTLAVSVVIKGLSYLFGG